jgi:dihydrodipicolinate synthase/N-acetylneuraminate lyase
MAVTNIFIPTGKGFGLKTMEQIMSKTDNVLAVKDDVCGEFARELSVLVGEHMAVWAGGQKQNHMNMAPYGADGYLSTFLTFKPDIAWQYWKAFSGGDMKGAVDVIREYDMPLFEFISGGALPGSFDAALHGILELFGQAERWCPKPYYSLSDGEMEILGNFLKAEGIL